MDKQYHSQWTPRGKETWEVARLIELARSLSVKRIPINEISQFEEVYWFDEDFKPSCRAVVKHARRIDAVDLQYPIIQSARGPVMDGMHRVAKAMLLGQETMEAVQFEQDPEPDSIASSQANPSWAGA